MKEWRIKRCITIKKEINKLAMELAEKEKRTVSNLIEHLILSYEKERKNKDGL